MKLRNLAALTLTILSVSSAFAADPPVDLEAGFHNPPTTAKSLTFWMWMNGNVTKEGITADLEAFKRVGLSGTEQFLIGGTESALDDPSLVFMSERWRNLEKFAETESARLGLEFGTHNCPGWSSSGGKWITPELSMQKVISGEVTFKGPGKYTGQLPTGPAFQGYYEDICVLAFKTQRYTGGPGQNGPPRGATPGTGTYVVGPGRGTPIAAVPQDSIIDLTSKMAPDGTLTWDAPEGDWTIARFGHTSTGQTNAASPTPAIGLECDKMNPAAIEAHYAAYPEKLLQDAGDLAGTTFKRFEIDSYEVKGQDWTPKMREEFQKRRGYDIIPFLVYTTKRNILDKNGVDISDRLANDWNLTISDLYIQNYYGHLQDLIHKTPGLQFMFEPYNTQIVCPFDSNNLCKVGDMLTAEYWQRPTMWGWNCVKTVTSGAHTWGKSLVAAESFTGTPDNAYQSDPYLLKSTGDRAYALGVNKFVFHTSAMQPWLNVAPGMTMGPWGTHFGRTITWWDHGAKEWIAYQGRAQFLLQQGKSVGDLAFLQYDRRDPLIPAGYDGDNIGTDAIMTRLTVKDGRLTMPDGISYAALVLCDWHRAMTPELLTKLKDLISQGGVVIGAKPTSSPSLENYPAADKQVADMANDIWGDANGTTVTEHAYGKGRVFWGTTPADALAKLKVSPDLKIDAAAIPSPFMWVHRHLDDADIYFISNQSDNPVSGEASIRIAGKIPELWHAETESIEQAPVWQVQDGYTHLSLAMPPSGSVFVIFRKSSAGVDQVVGVQQGNAPSAAQVKVEDGGLALTAAEAGDYTVKTASGKTKTVTAPALPEPLDLSTNWAIAFPPKLGAPDGIKLDKLMNLSQHETPGVKYFSGTMTYSKNFDLPASLIAPGRVLTLDLGTVKNIAEVRLNGKDLPLMWLPPFSADVTPYLKAGSNSLEIKITNLWVNRLIGDEQLPDDLQWAPARKGTAGQNLAVVPDWINDLTKRPSKDRVTFVTYKTYNARSPLPASGLIGPVTIQSAQKIELKP